MFPGLQVCQTASMLCSVGRNDIQSLCDLKVPIAVISKRLGISRSTLYNKIKCFGLEPPKYSNVTKKDLTDHIQTIKKDHPNCREVTHDQGVEARRLCVGGSTVFHALCICGMWTGITSLPDT